MKSLWKYLLPLVSAGLFILAVVYVFRGQEQDGKSVPLPVSPPPTSPYVQSVAGAGLIEPQSESIAIGSSSSGLVKHVAVKVGDRVEAGAVLFQLDDRELLAQRQVQQSAIAAAQADLERLEHLPRPEDVPVAEAQVARTEATVQESTRELERVERLAKNNAATQSQLDTARLAKDVAIAERAGAQAQLELLQAGAWQYEKLVAKASVERAKAELHRIQTALDLLTITAPIAGEVLQVNVRPGEFVGMPATQTLLWLGDTKVLHVRVDIDEHDIPMFRTGAPAMGQLRGGSDQRFKLSFVRVEPMVVPKRSLTGANTERIDTRVLQVIYRIDEPSKDFYVGQQVDVFVDVASDDRERSNSQASLSDHSPSRGVVVGK